MQKIKRMIGAIWRWFMGLSAKGKAITVGAVVLVAVIGAVTSEPPEDAPTASETISDGDAEDSSPTPGASPSPTSQTQATDPATSSSATIGGCDVIDGKVQVSPDCLAEDEEWPLTADSGDVYCTEGTAALLRVPAGQPGGGIYALNGIASTMFDNLPPLENVWLENPDIPDTRIPITPLLDRALQMCEDA